MEREDLLLIHILRLTPHAEGPRREERDHHRQSFQGRSRLRLHNADLNYVVSLYFSSDRSRDLDLTTPLPNSRTGRARTLPLFLNPSEPVLTLWRSGFDLWEK